MQATPAPKAGQGPLPGLELADVAAVSGHLRTVRSPEFSSMVFHEVIAKSALNRVPGASSMPFSWTINPYRGCSHACVYCFARGSHRYLDFDTGKDFDSQIVVKVNIAQVLARELARQGWRHEHVALGTNTDPYQRAEGRYQLMPGVIDALAASGTPFSILTKGTLLRRDLPRLAEARDRTGVSLAMSIAIADPALQQAIEPGTPTTRTRLDTVAAARDAGFECEVFVMPVLPHLTDSVSQLTRLLHDIREAGASSVIYGALHLRSHVKPWFYQWLEQHHPELVPRYHALYPGANARASKAYRLELAARIRPLMRRFGLERRAVRVDPTDLSSSTRHPTSAARPRAAMREAAAAAPGLPVATTLF